ncbi:Gfo/Idh/MocA family oxidoreductase [Vibrio sp. 10N.222.51.E8]|uniref:Gfo/Idh/MocA family oxidoreductase n=1 Tax=unclassified Vibrio TaxID=2614977 RepID=UPI0010BE0B88|nr:Gfo/Idh/MocA family oxidoreductase [Vibrio sp. F13]TKG36979.1 Gfo/Idh/MocA family oxidoreductase [Vibrio sp. F13]
MIWLVGAGPMSVEYAKVLSGMGEKFEVIGRSQASADDFFQATGKNAITGGVEAYIKETSDTPNAAIVSVGVGQLYETTLKLIEFGVSNILVEKPGAISKKQLQNLNAKAQAFGACVSIAYNRRFLSSVIELKERIESEGGVTSFNFEFTEWAHIIEKLDKPEEVLQKWFLANSTHVADLAFYLGGKPKKLASFVAGGLDWHSSGSVFSGAGVSESGALFNYGSNWESAGRWSVEVLTAYNRYVLRPMEQLQVQKKGTIPLISVDLDEQLDIRFKPGLYRQVQAFLEQDIEQLCSIEEQLKCFPFYQRVANYNSSI